MEIVDHALHALSDEVMVPHSGWEQGSNGANAGEENCKPRHLEWEIALTNTAGCLRYGGRKARRRQHQRCVMKEGWKEGWFVCGWEPKVEACQVNRLIEQWDV